MERQKHHMEKYGNHPNQHQFHSGAYNKHAGDHLADKYKSNAMLSKQRTRGHQNTQKPTK